MSVILTQLSLSIFFFISPCYAVGEWVGVTVALEKTTVVSNALLILKISLPVQH